MFIETLSFEQTCTIVVCKLGVIILALLRLMNSNSSIYLVQEELLVIDRQLNISAGAVLQVAIIVRKYKFR